MSDLKNKNETGLPESLAVYTFLHRKNALERFDAILNQETLLYYMPAAGGMSFSLPSARMINFNHLLLFEGMTIEGGMSERIKRLDILYASEQEDDRILLIRANKSCVSQWIDGDYHLKIDSLPYRYRDGDIVEQKSKRYLVAVPKGDERFIFLAFRDRSLEPVFKTVRSLPHELIIETASSY